MRTGESFRKEEYIRMVPVNFANAPLPERQSLRVRVVYTKDLNLTLNPEPEYTVELIPKPTPVSRLKVQRINILIFLRRVFGILDTPVRDGA